ncbi:uncharacterized protein PAS_chr3_0804 [Komagataella phaffii GS115]|uniref:DUF155 domain-containing protein n=1 Tax=Komagataella phaffii (strain GS115 / ATCC 20864) TaxID=644223 RepID=C4R5M1_KOMPG|nr:uncharacterized protein PAS_chr3_0804 [Komagataella phaffii GS115]AOA64158.1 GQ67_03909T0 [Komagataella phaffii]AOA68837.1 GQ68_03883T0 [Komagataella phaffii GS115]CAH2449343.1 Predicted protein [Komagataella phaffii CBS 7435]CAY70857.1 Putative protein of unknown function [Komagataella phaffii GS115]
MFMRRVSIIKPQNPFRCRSTGFSRLFADSVKARITPVKHNMNLNRLSLNTLLDANHTKALDDKLMGHKILPCSTITVSEAFDLKELFRNLNSRKFQCSLIVPDEMIHVKYERNPEATGTNDSQFHDILFLHTGTVVAWGLTEKQVESSILPLAESSIVTKYEPESEDMDYIEIEPQTSDRNSGSYMAGDVMVISGSHYNDRLLDKIAFAYGLARSTRTAVIESSLERHIQMTKKTTENLSTGIKLGVDAKEVLKSTGRLLLLRGKLNLYSELIETPDLYWSEPHLEKIYKDISKTLDVNPRISILNRKLDYATEESKSLLATLNEEKSVRLEWIIIYLIMIEVCFEIFHFYERYVDYKTKSTSTEHV